MNDIKEKEITKIKLTEIHTKRYLELLKETTYKNQNVVFILVSGKEYK